MIKIPPEVQIKSTIKPGSVFYFPEHTFKSAEPHYFIVLNHKPISDDVILLVCASSKVKKVKRRRRNLPSTTVVIRKEQYADFTENSIIDCNDVFNRSIRELVEKLEQGELKPKKEMGIALVKKLREAVDKSPLVSRQLKAILHSK